MANKGTENPEFKKNIGRWKDPAAAKAASDKGNAVLKARAEAKRKLRDKQAWVSEAAAAVVAENPDLMQDIIKMLTDIINDPNADTKDRMAALDRFTTIVGTQAPKQSEVKVEEKQIDKEEAAKILEGLRVVK